MKKIFRLFGLGGLLTAALAVGAVASFGQDPCADVDGQNALYNDVLTNYKSNDPAVIRKAADSAKQFLEKFGSCEVAKAQVDWMKPKVEGWTKRANDIDFGIKRDALYKRFDSGFKASNWDEVYASGKDILAAEPDKLDVILVLASVGFDQAGKKNNKFNDDAVNYAKIALKKLDAGAKSDTGKYGLFSYAYNTKENAEGWMNMIIGYITYEPKNDRKGALPYIYKATQTGPETTVYAVPYELIGRYFLGESTKLRDEMKEMLAKPVDPNATPEQKAQQEADYKAKAAMFNGTLDRALDGYTRAYKFAKTSDKAYKDAMYGKIKDIYAVRFQKDAGVDEYIASTVAKPLTDPASPVTPVEDVDVKTETTTKTTTSATPTPTPAKPAGAKPGETSGITKAASETAAKGVKKTSH